MNSFESCFLVTLAFLLGINFKQIIVRVYMTLKNLNGMVKQKRSGESKWGYNFY